MQRWFRGLGAVQLQRCRGAEVKRCRGVERSRGLERCRSVEVQICRRGGEEVLVQR